MSLICGGFSVEVSPIKRFSLRTVGTAVSEVYLKLQDIWNRWTPRQAIAPF